MNNNVNIEYELIGKYLSKEISVEEQQLLDQWLDESDINKRLFENLKNDEEYFSFYNTIRNVDVLKAKELTWFKINKMSRLQERFETETNEAVNKLYLKRFLQYAASLLVLIGLASIFYLEFHKPDSTATFTQITAPKGSRTNLKLADGSSIWLNAGSTLKYDNNFNKKERIVYLEGEAFFDVSKNAQKPFYVKTSDISMKVLGTSFNVKSYSDENTIQTTLVSGSVVIERNNAPNDENKVVLKPNQKAIFIKNRNKVVVNNIAAKNNIPTQPGKKAVTEGASSTNQTVNQEDKIVIADKVNIEQDISWKDGYMLIKQESLEDLAVKLARHYDVVFTFQSEDIKKYRYTGKIYDLTLDQVLNAIKFSSPIVYKIDKKNVIISKK